MKKIVLLFILVASMFSCSSHHLSYTANNNIKNVSLNMTKKEVVSAMGKHYMPVRLFQSDEGSNEVIGYEASSNERYELSFINNKLVSWERVLVKKFDHCNDAKKAKPATSAQAL